MARTLIRAAPIYLDGKKIAEVSSGSYDVASGDEAQIGSDGYLGHSDGATTTRFSFDCIIPVKGMAVKVDDLILNKRYFSLGLPVNGKFHQVDARMTGASYKWDHRNGTFMGTFSAEGGAPDILG